MSNDVMVVCGGTGFLGRALIADLKKQGHKRIRSVSRDIDGHGEWKAFHIERWEERDGVEYVSADLSHEGQALGAVRNAKHVYNLAATVVGGIDFIHQNRATAMLSAQINMNLLKACRQEAGIERYFYASSACVYGQSCEWPRSESETAVPERGYGWEKLFGEQLCHEWREAGFVDTRVARLFTLYGPGDDKKHNHFPAELCKKIAVAKHTQQKSIDVWGDGRQSRSLLYVDDAVEGIQRLMKSGVTGVLNLSSPQAFTVRDMVDLVQSIAGTKLEVNYGGGTTGVACRFSDNFEILRALGWEPPTKLGDGFQKTWDWWWDRVVNNRKNSHIPLEP